MSTGSWPSEDAQAQAIFEALRAAIPEESREDDAPADAEPDVRRDVSFADPTTPPVEPATATSREQPVSRPQEHAHLRGSCVLVGPSNAGKTCMLAAINAACYADAADPQLSMSVVSTPALDEEERLARYVVEWIGRGEPPHVTELLRTYELEVATHVRGGLFRPSEMIATTIRCSDAPGGSLFAGRSDLNEQRVNQQIWQELINRAAEATTLVLVIDSQDPLVDLVEMHLPPLLDRLARPSKREALRQSLPVQLMMKLGLMSRRDGGRRTRLNASRVLLLLTKIDELALALARQLEERGVPTTPLAVAESLDPLSLALEYLGERPLRRIRRALDIDAEFAIGVVSATGFLRDGQSFVPWSEHRTEEERLRAWHSFGIQEALLFMTTGRCVGPIRRVTSDRELSLEGALEASDFPFRARCS